MKIDFSLHNLSMVSQKLSRRTPWGIKGKTSASFRSAYPYKKNVKAHSLVDAHIRVVCGLRQKLRHVLQTDLKIILFTFPVH